MISLLLSQLARNFSNELDFNQAWRAFRFECNGKSFEVLASMFLAPLERAKWTFIAEICPRCYTTFVSFQGQYFSGGSFRIYLLGNPIIWWSNLAFLAMFLLTYFMAAVKQQRGYDADEQAEARSKWNCVRRGIRFYDELGYVRTKFPRGDDVTEAGAIISYGHKAHMRPSHSAAFPPPHHNGDVS